MRSRQQRPGPRREGARALRGDPLCPFLLRLQTGWGPGVVLGSLATQSRKPEWRARTQGPEEVQGLRVRVRISPPCSPRLPAGLGCSPGLLPWQPTACPGSGGAHPRPPKGGIQASVLPLDLRCSWDPLLHGPSALFLGTGADLKRGPPLSTPLLGPLPSRHELAAGGGLSGEPGCRP